MAGQGLFQEERRSPVLAAAARPRRGHRRPRLVEPAQLAALMAGADVALTLRRHP
ncbi:MAG: hypothetical protein IPJ58_16330 [Ardenticatenia bacterium]|nr:hypothetical protein [Ardenticatenia bacterium]